MEKNITDISALIELYAMGELEPDKIPVVEEYLRKNPFVMQEIEEIRLIADAVSKSKLDEPETRVVLKTKDSVHALMEREKSKPVVPFFRDFFRIITRPAFASAAALITITLCLLFIFIPRNTEQDVITKNTKKGTTSVGFAITAEKDFKEYISYSADIFSSFLQNNADSVKNLLDADRIVNEIGQAMKLLENEIIIEDYDLNSLVSDIESVWRSLKDLAEGKSTVTYENIKTDILDKKILDRINKYQKGN